MASLEGGDREAKKKVTSSQEEDQSGAEEMTMGGQEPGDIERDEWWLYWLNRDRHIDDPSYSSIKMMGIPHQIDNDATAAVVRYWNAIENEETYRNAIKKDAVTPVKYWNAWQMSMHGRSWADEGNASSCEFQRLYDLGTSIANQRPLSQLSVKRRLMVRRYKEDGIGRSSIWEFAEEMHRMRVKNSKKEAASKSTKSTRKRNARGRATLVRSNTDRS